MAMRHINIPEKIIKIMLSSYEKARITININGKGDGFLKPTQGLRQGCPMSPYMFIISMEILSRLMQKTVSNGELKGVKVARTSPQFTHAVYADDLVILGDAQQTEVQKSIQILQLFSTASGLHVNPQKSKLWFSNKCNEQIISRVQQQWCANKVEGEEKYLGVMMSDRGDIKRNGRVLLEKIKSKLSGWKSQMLSHAGRLVLIKAVLMSMPVYSMSLEMLPKEIIQDINRLLAKFFWGKVGQDRYLSWISWKKVCVPACMGGGWE